LPVRAGLAPAAELYPHSSAYRQTPIGSAPAPPTVPSTTSSEDTEPKPVESSATPLRKVAS
jgi:hypothetical protein